MAVNKAQLFSLIALMISAFFILVFASMTRVPLDKSVDRVEAEVLSLNDVVLDFETIVESSVETSSLQILNFSVDYLNGTNYFLDFRDFFDTCFRYGTFNDYYDSVTPTKMCSSYGLDVSIGQQLEKVFTQTEHIHDLEISMSHLVYSMDLYDAYSLEVNLTILLDIKLNSLKKNIAWKRKIDISQQVDFTGIIDPASIGTNFLRRIRYGPEGRTFSRVGFDGNNVTVINYLNKHSSDNTYSPYYFLDDSGPSLFERMQGNKTETFDLVESRRFGIATFIPPVNQSGDSLYLVNISMVDHHYDWGANPADTFLRLFNSTSGINSNITLYYHYVIQGMDFFEVDLEHAQGNCDVDGCEYPT